MAVKLLPPIWVISAYLRLVSLPYRSFLAGRELAPQPFKCALFEASDLRMFGRVTVLRFESVGRVY